MINIIILEIKGDSVIQSHRSLYSNKISRVICFPLYAILLALGNPVVDFFSLDVEGAELLILKTIPWPKVNIKVTI